MKPAVLHGRNTGSFGFGLAALCGEKGPPDDDEHEWICEGDLGRGLVEEKRKRQKATL